MRLLFVGSAVVTHGVVARVNELARGDANMHEFVFRDLAPVPAVTKESTSTL